MLFISLEMRHQPFFGWIKDLSAQDPTSLFNLFCLIPLDPTGFMIIGIWPKLMVDSIATYMAYLHRCCITFKCVNKSVIVINDCFILWNKHLARCSARGLHRDLAWLQLRPYIVYVCRLRTCIALLSARLQVLYCINTEGFAPLTCAGGYHVLRTHHVKKRMYTQIRTLDYMNLFCSSTWLPK